MGKQGHAGTGRWLTLEDPMFIVLPALALLISVMFVVTMVAALSAGRDDAAAIRTPGKRGLF